MVGLTGDGKLKTIMGIVALAVAVRLTIFLSIHSGAGLAGFSNPDTQSYVIPAENLLQGHGFKTTLPDGNLYWETMRTPVYPYLICGLKTVSSVAWPYLLIGGQILADCLLVILIIALTRSYGGDRAAVVAGLAYALSPGAAIYTTKLLTETLFSILSFVALCIPLLVTSSRRQFAGWQMLVTGCVSGVLFGLASLTRPLGYYVFAVLLIVMTVVTVAGKSSPRHGRSLAKMWSCALLVYLAIVGAWVARNGIRTGYWSISSIDYVNLAFFRAAPAEAAQTGRGLETVYDAYKAKYGLENAPVWDESPEGLRKGKEMKRDAVSTIAENKIGYLKIAVTGTIGMMFGPNRHDLKTIFGESAGEVMSVIIAVVIVLIWVLAGIGYWSYLNLWPVVLLGCCLVGVSAGYEAYARFRVVLEPLLATGVGLGLNFVRKRYSINFFTGSQTSH